MARAEEAGGRAAPSRRGPPSVLRRGRLAFGTRAPRRGLRATLATLVVLASTAALPLDKVHAAASFVVDSTTDATDASPGDGACLTATLECTLRAAIQEANALPGADTISLPPGTYELAIQPLNHNDITTGDLDISESLTITGAGAGSSIIDGGSPKAGSPAEVHGLDRLLDVHANEGTVTLYGLTLRDGYADEYGGGIYNGSTAIVTVTASDLTGNVAGKSGGAIDNHLGGAVHVSESTISGNFASGSGSALNNNRGGSLRVTNSTVSGNSAEVVGLDESLMGAGAISNNAELDAVGTITVTGSQISDNRAGGGRSGAGISNDGAGTVSVVGTTFVKNRAAGDGGAIFNVNGLVTVTDSTFSENEGKDGGAISSSGQGSLSVIHSVFSKNVASDWGGAIQNGNKGSASVRSSSFTENIGLNGGGFANEGTGLVTVIDSTFAKNTVLESGGGLHTNSGAEVVVTGGTFSENTARDGGGLSNEGGGEVTVTGTTLSNNTAQQEGGGVLIQSGALTLRNVEIVGNLANGTVTGGGGISIVGDKSPKSGSVRTVDIEGSVIKGNMANMTGGGIDMRGDGQLGITTTTIESNVAKIGGGVYHAGDAELNVNQSTVAKNHAEEGGGLFLDGDGAATVENSTVSGNIASQSGGGMLVFSRLTALSTTVTGNSAPSGGGIKNGSEVELDGFVLLGNTIVAGNPTGGNCAGSMTSQGGNIDNLDTCRFRESTDQPGTDPRLGPLADNGGPTQTHALLGGSPAQDAAECTSSPCPPLDQRGVVRPNGVGYDIGSYESELLPAPPPDPTCTGRSERTLLASADSWIGQGAPGSNFGHDSILKVKSQSGANARALLRFELPPAPPGCVLVGATLRLHSSSATAGRTLTAARIGSSWTESGVTWADQPPITGPVATTGSGLGYREWNVTGQTGDMYAGDNHGFLIRDAAEGGAGFEQSFHSREKGTDAPPELVLIFDAPPGGDPICPSAARTLLADSDSWINQGSPGDNRGADSTLKVKSQSGGGNSRALVRFPLPELPAGCTGVASATLSLHAGSGTSGGTLRALRNDSFWSEGSVTWSNQPAVTGTAATAPSGPGMREWNVTDQVQSMYSTGNHGFQIRDAAENGTGDEQAFHSREKAPDNPPTLVITFE